MLCKDGLSPYCPIYFSYRISTILLFCITFIKTNRCSGRSCIDFDSCFHRFTIKYCEIYCFVKASYCFIRPLYCFTKALYCFITASYCFAKTLYCFITALYCFTNVPYCCAIHFLIHTLLIRNLDSYYRALPFIP